MTFNIWKRSDSTVLQYLVPNSKREAYIASVKDTNGNNLYAKIGTTSEGTDTPVPPPSADGGDMLKATYDTNLNNIVDRAERADAMSWNGFI